MNCQEVYVGGGSYGPVLECTQPEGHDGWHRNDFGVAWGDPVEAACVIFGERAHTSALDARTTLGPVSGDGITRARARGDFPRLLVDLWGMASRVYVRQRFDTLP